MTLFASYPPIYLQMEVIHDIVPVPERESRSPDERVADMREWTQAVNEGRAAERKRVKARLTREYVATFAELTEVLDAKYAEIGKMRDAYLYFIAAGGNEYIVHHMTPRQRAISKLTEADVVEWRGEAESVITMAFDAAVVGVQEATQAELFKWDADWSNRDEQAAAADWWQGLNSRHQEFLLRQD